MNYEKVSDFEINKAVAEALGNTVSYDYAHDADARSVRLTSSRGWVDYCNNPTDAWPIIVENKINIDFQYGVLPIAEYDEYIFTDKNPLRAAMIVFLMMQEHKELDK